MTRPTYDSYFMSLAHAAATMGTCSRRQVGAVAVRDKRVLATGFNGSPAGTHHCEHERYNECERCEWESKKSFDRLPRCPHCSKTIDYEAKYLDGKDPDLITVNGRSSCSNAVHAEANVISYAAAYGVALKGSSIYTNTFPCHGCAKQMVSCGIIEVVYDADYNNDPLVARLFEEAKVNIRRFEPSK